MSQMTRCIFLHTVICAHRAGTPNITGVQRKILVIAGDMVLVIILSLRKGIHVISIFILTDCYEKIYFSGLSYNKKQTPALGPRLH
jgi:hypothetical protein